MPRWSLEKRSMLRKLNKDVFKDSDPGNDGKGKDPGKKINRKVSKLKTHVLLILWNLGILTFIRK